MLEHVEIKNFRSCFDTSLYLGRTIYAISGRNGVGKSNILKSIDWISRTAISAYPVSVAAAGNFSQNLDEVSVSTTINIDDFRYRYVFSVPGNARNSASASIVESGLVESVQLLSAGGVCEELLSRRGDIVRVKGRPDPIRIPRTTPMLAAIMSLLPSDEDVVAHIRRIDSFFSGVRYYSLDDRPDAKESVTERQYSDWEFRYKTEGYLPDSIALRLIYMWKHDSSLLDEFMAIVGPKGIGLIERFAIIPLERQVRPQELGENEASGPKTVYYPIFTPSSLMGGAGGSFTFLELSVGTRRVIRIVASLLFDRRSLMLLEQPEDSIHSGLLRKLMDVLRSYSSKTQFIFTTHSLEVLDLMKPEEVILVTASGGKTGARSLSVGELDLAKEFLRDEGSLSDYLEILTNP